MSLAEVALGRGRRNLSAEIYEDASRNAYSAALNAARAVIFDKAFIATKTHSGTRAKFFELIHDGMPFDAELAQFLREAFETKQGIDYGPEILVSREEAEDYLNRAAAFIAAAKAVCAGN
jgi:uncharacterized protein (UPF0332 family)